MLKSSNKQAVLLPEEELLYKKLGPRAVKAEVLHCGEAPENRKEMLPESEESEEIEFSQT